MLDWLPFDVRNRKPWPRISFGLPARLSIRGFGRVMVRSRSGANLDRESVRVRQPKHAWPNLSSLPGNPWLRSKFHRSQCLGV